MLIEGEKIIIKTSPHPLSFWPYYLFFVYYITVGIAFLMKYDDIASWLSSRVPWDWLTLPLVVALWIALIVIPAIIFSVTMIAWKWAIMYSLIGVASIYLLVTQKATLFDLQYFIVGIGIIGFFLTELFRRSHEYIVTNYRIITRMGFFGATERQIFYSKITDVVVKQGLLGRVFNYGTVFPLTASGIGTGEDVAAVLASVGGGKETPVGKLGGDIAVLGSKSVTVPRGRTSLVLYGVPDPEEVKKVIVERIAKTEVSHYIERWEEMLKKLVGKSD